MAPTDTEISQIGAIITAVRELKRNQNYFNLREKKVSFGFAFKNNG